MDLIKLGREAETFCYANLQPIVGSPSNFISGTFIQRLHHQSLTFA